MSNLLKQLQEESLIGMSPEEISLTDFDEKQKNFLQKSWEVIKPLYKNRNKAEEDEQRFRAAENLRKR